MNSCNFVLSRVEHEKVYNLWPYIDPCILNGDICSLLINFTNSIDPDQDQHNVGPDLDPNRLTL